MTRHAIPLPDQIEEAELHRASAERVVSTNPSLMFRLHRSEAICLSLAMLAANETEFRAFMAQRKDRA